AAATGSQPRRRVPIQKRRRNFRSYLMDSPPPVSSTSTTTCSRSDKGRWVRVHCSAPSLGSNRDRFAPKADKRTLASICPLSADIVAKVAEQMLWNSNLKQSNRGARTFESMLRVRVKTRINVTRSDGQNTFATVSALLRPREMSDLGPQSGPKMG